MEHSSIERLIWTIRDHHLERETAEKRLELKIYTDRMIQQFGRLLSELLGHRLARIYI
jgi:hypothetical protein